MKMLMPIRFCGLTVDERTFYRGLRRLGFDKHDASMVMIGALSAAGRLSECVTLGAIRPKP